MSKEKDNCRHQLHCLARTVFRCYSFPCCPEPPVFLRRRRRRAAAAVREIHHAVLVVGSPRDGNYSISAATAADVLHDSSKRRKGRGGGEEGWLSDHVSFTELELCPNHYADSQDPDLLAYFSDSLTFFSS